jgi:hypothetical protein
MFRDGREDKIKDFDISNISGNALFGRSGAGVEYQTGNLAYV